MIDFNDLKEIAGRIEKTLQQLEAIEPSAALADQVWAYKSEDEKNLLSKYMIKAEKELAHTYPPGRTAPESRLERMARADTGYLDELSAKKVAIAAAAQARSKRDRLDAQLGALRTLYSGSKATLNL